MAIDIDLSAAMNPEEAPPVEEATTTQEDTGAEPPVLDVGMGKPAGGGQGQGGGGGSAKGVPVDPHTASLLSSAYTHDPVANPKPKPPNPGGYTANRAEAENPDHFWDVLQSTAGVPTKQKVGYLQKFLETPSVDMTHLKEAPLTGAYQLAKLAESEGYKVVFQSGARGGGGTSYHDHGEAVDVRFQKVLSNGKVQELTPRENVEMGKRLGKQAGFASALDEFHFWSDGKPKSDPWNNAPHVHLAWGNERGLSEHPMHTELTKRHWTDADYLKQPVFSPEYKGVKPSKDRTEHSRTPGLVETIAYSMGVDPDFALNIANAESGFNPKAVSPVGALGIMQMMPDTIKEVAPKVGMTVEDYYRSPRAQIKMGMYYLREKIKENNGNLARAAAAYNAGSGGLQSIIEGKDYPETKDYVYKVMKEIDPSINSPEAALSAIRNGTGRSRDVAKEQKFAKDVVSGVKQQTQDIWSELSSDQGVQTNLRALGDAVGATAKTVEFETESFKDPLSGKRRLTGLVNEMLHDATFGIIPLFESTLESSKAHKEVVGDWNNPFSLEGFAEYGTTLTFGGLRTWAAAMTGGILAKGLRLLPGIGGILAKGDASAAALKAMGEAPAVAEGGNLFSKVTNLVKGGPLEIFQANLLEQASAGSVALGIYNASDYMWKNPDQAQGLDYLKGIVGEGLTGGVLGGMMGIGMGLGLPLFGGAGLITMNRLTGFGSANMADNAVTNIAKHIGEMGPVQRTLAGGGFGALGGALTGAAANVTGLDDLLTGQDMSSGDSIMAGAQIFGGLGAGAGLGYNKLGSMVDRVVASKVMQMPGVKQVRESVHNMVKNMNEQTVRMMSQELIDAQAEQMNIFKKGVAEANGTLYSARLGSTLKDVEKAHAEQTATRDSLKAQVMQIQEQGELFAESEQQLAQRYPLAAAYDANRSLKISQLKSLGQDPNKAAKAAELKADLEALTNQLKTDKDLNREMSLWNTDKARLQQAQANWAQKGQALQESLALQEADVAGLDFVKSLYTQTKGTLDEHLANAATTQDMGGLKPDLKLDFPWAPSKDARTLLTNRTAEEGAHLEALNDMLIRQYRAMVEGGSPEAMNMELLRTQAAKGAYEGDNFYGAVQKRIADVKKSAEEIINRAPQTPTIYKSAKSFGAWNKTQIADWSPDVPAGHKIASVNAEALRAGLLEELEKGGAGVDRSALWQEAGERAKARYSAKGLKVPTFDKAQMLDLVKDAEAAIRLGEKELPVSINNGSAAEFNKLAKRGDELVVAQTKEATQKEIGDLAKIFTTKGPMAAVNPITTGPDGMPVPGDLAEGAVLDDVMNPNLSWPNALKRLSGIEESVKEALGTFGDIEAYTHFMNTGNMSFLPEEVKKFIASGGDLAQAPPSVKAWSDAVTLARVEEVKRVRRLQNLLRGKDDEGAAIMANIRNAQAAGYTPPTFGMTPEPFLKAMADFGQHDARVTAMANKPFAEIASGDNKTMWEQVLPASRNFFHDHIYSRMNALSVVKGRILEPKWAQIEKGLAENIKAKGLTYDLDGLYKEFTAAVEDTGKLIKFKENYPEAEDMVNFYYGMQDYMESVVAMSPQLKPWVQANYLPHRFRKLASHIKSARADEQLSMAEAIAGGKTIGKFRTLEEVDEAVKGVSKEVSAAGFNSDEEFLNMDLTERAKRFKFFRAPDMDQAWKDLTPLEQKKATEEVTKKAMTLLLQDPVHNPMELIDMQISSLFRADSQRRFLTSLANTPAMLDETGKVANLVAKADYSALHVLDSKGAKQTYKYLSDTPGMAGVELELNGETLKAKEIKVHPEVHRFLNEFAMGSGYAENGIVRGIQRLQSIFRQSVLLGTFIPHQLNTLSGPMMEFATTPLKMMKLMVGGANLGGGEQFSQAAMVANAVRSGLNIRTLERSAGVMAQSIFQDFGPEITGKLAGLEDNGLLKFLQALDPSDPKAPMARQALKDAGGLSKIAGNATDVLGLPAQLDHMVNSEMLFRPIEMGQMAGYHLRAQKYLMENLNNPKLAHLDAAEKMRVAMREAAHQSNLAAGALPHIFQNNTMRQAASSMLLTPSWLMSKAYMLADSIDAIGHLATGKSVASLFGRRPFDHLPEGARNATRQRMAGMLAAGLMGSLAMTQATQYFATGTLTTDHPPDKLLHIKIGDEYVTGPVMGYVKDVLRFGVDALSPDGITKDPGLQSIYDAGVKAVTRQLNPSLGDITKYLFSAHKGEVLSAPDLMATFVNSLASEMGGASLETLGIDKKSFKAENLPGYVGLGSEEQKMAAKNSILKSRHYLMQQAGLYSSPDNLDMQIRGEFYNRKKDVEFRARGLISPLLAKAKAADSYEEQNRFLSAAYDQFYKGIPIRDKFMLQYYPEGVYRLSDKEFQSLVLEHFNPSAKSIEGLNNTPLGMMVAKAQTDYGR